MKLYNSLTKTVQDFKPLTPPHVRMYSCGPTVYNNLHIGNLSAFIYADILRRTLETADYKVTHVMNITDVDDKTIRDSQVTYPNKDPKTALQMLTQKYTDVFKADMQAVGNDISALQFVSAVESITDMITLTQKLLDTGIAYIAEDGIYFSVANYQEDHTYGVLQKVHVNTSRERIQNDEYDKDNVTDFALWKARKDSEPAWDASYTFEGQTIDMPGRPGWHIECSAMSEKLLGLPFDIHTGGIDLKFPHHENEIAQSCGAGAESMATFFVHNGHMMVDGKKMSKSLGNFYTLRDIEKHGFSAQIFRMVVLESHYRSESNFSWEILEAAQNRLQNWRIAACRIHQPLKIPRKLNRYVFKNIQDALLDDLNTPLALALINAVLDDINAHGIASDETDRFNGFLTKIGENLGIILKVDDIDHSLKALIKERDQAKLAKDWSKSDEIRNQLRERGIGINDTAAGQVWFYI